MASELGIEGRFRVKYHLHPPVLRRLGFEKKLPMGRPYELAFRALRRMKWVRGTPLDVFGWDPDRRTERAVIDEYEQLIATVVAGPTELDYDARVQLARSPMAIKGYGPIKEEAVARWRQDVVALQQASTSVVAAAP